MNLLTYADLRISQGNLYKELGFSYSHRSSPNYFWVKVHKTLSRYQTQKHKLQELLGDKFDPKLTEVENMHLSGWKRVYDAGNLVCVKHF